MVAILADQQLRQQAGRGQTVVGHALRRGRDHRRQLALAHAHIFGPDGFLPEKFARLVVQLPADFLADAFPLFRLGQDQFRFDDLRAPLPGCPGVRRRWVWARGRCGAGRAGGSSSSSSAARLPSARPLMSSSSWAASNCSLFLPKNRRARASSFWRKTVFSRRDCSSAWRFVPRSAARRPPAVAAGGFAFAVPPHSSSVNQTTRRPGCSNFFAIYEKSFYTLRGALIPGPARPVLQIHPVQQQLQGLRGQTDFDPWLSRALRPVKGSLFQPLGQHAHARAVKIQES